MQDDANAGSALPVTPLTTLRRLPNRGSYDRALVHAVLDEGLVCQLGFAVEGQPFVVPTSYGRVGDTLYVHGASVSRALTTLERGVPACVSVSLLDGLVLARSAFHHSVNYRSVMVFGRARAVRDDPERMEALRAIVEHVVPGRWASVRPPSAVELKATLVLALPIDEASAKVRTGPPIDDEEDYASTAWAGVLPLQLVPGQPVPDPRLPPGVAVPEHVRAYRRLGPAAGDASR